VQIHGMDKDPFLALEGDIDAARELVETVGPELAGLFVYPGDRHLFADNSMRIGGAGRSDLNRFDTLHVGASADGRSGVRDIVPVVVCCV
jgi:hypothetical protein